ncbi:MAG: type II toxin-antitoxin system RelE/ParE family toxin [Thaumarchaeota archaeon]|nr:type II toxin-antitoxin system RelE/ParE family toxin [Nitrososphaerota archaeon]
MDKRHARMIRDAVVGARGNPYAAVSRLSDSAFFRMRVGSYRIIMGLQQGSIIIFVIEAGHRRRVYG